MTKLTLEVIGDTQVIVRRRFNAPPEAVWRAHTEAALMQKWLTGPDGWVMTHCLSDPVPGGKLRCDWQGPDGAGFYLTGEYRALEPFRRFAHVERMFLPDATPDNECETVLRPDGSGTLLILTMTLPDAASREAMLATGMEEGMEASYARLDDIALAAT